MAAIHLPLTKTGGARFQKYFQRLAEVLCSIL